MKFKLLSYIFIVIILINSSSFITAMMKDEEETEQVMQEEQPEQNKIMLYSYHAEDNNIREGILSNYANPFTYFYFNDCFGGGFSLPEQYNGTVNITTINSSTYVGLLYCLMKDNKQLLSFIHANDSQVFVNIYNNIFNTKLKNKSENMSLMQLVYKEEWTNKNTVDGWDHIAMMIRHSLRFGSKSKNIRTCNNLSSLKDKQNLIVFINLEHPDKSYYSTESKHYFNRDNASYDTSGFSISTICNVS